MTKRFIVERGRARVRSALREAEPGPIAVINMFTVLPDELDGLLEAPIGETLTD